MNEVLFLQLLDRYLTGTLQEEERLQLIDMLGRGEYMPLLEAAMQESFLTNAYEGPPSQQRSEQMKAWLLSQMAEQERQAVMKSPVPYTPRVLRKWARAAAAAVIVLTAGTFIWMQQSSRQEMVQEQPITDIAPGSNKAILTLSDGSTVTLDSTGHQVIQQGVTAIRQNAGRLQYDVQGSTAAVSYNVLATPRGGQFQITLPDGTEVWLNAASSIKYPTVFIGKERKVQITGEAYFEVAKNAQMPFRVEINDQVEIEVLGTHFNVNSYTSEGEIKTTLLEGSVKIADAVPAGQQHKSSGTVILKPGQQAQMSTVSGSSDRRFNVLNSADIDQVMAWKNGFFSLQDANLQQLTRQLERWYDIRVEYEGAVPDVHFKGKMSMGVKLSTILNWFKDLGIRTRLEGRTLTIL